MPQQRHSGHAVEICRHRAVVYDQARQLNPRCWSRAIGCWRQPEVGWVHSSTTEIESTPAALSIAGEEQQKSVIFPGSHHLVDSICSLAYAKYLVTYYALIYELIFPFRSFGMG